MKKIIITLIIIVSILIPSLSFASWWGNDGNNVNNGSQLYEAKKTELNQRRLTEAEPIPEMTDSQERKNLIARLKLFNNSNKISYIYLINFGKVMAFYTIKGKVSSVNSLLTTPDQLVNADGSLCNNYHNTNASYCQKVASPDIDGSYGTNGEGIFFFTTEGAYVEYRGDYMLSDYPLKLTTQPELVRNIK